ncbi:hypothetical protein [Pontibacillus salipaludis]|uniref:hypothetical protein n=1 Tax=Pontibacillus salipaludis TaxID=1697394 RepID=UPI0031EA665E
MKKTIFLVLAVFFVTLTIPNSVFAFDPTENYVYKGSSAANGYYQYGGDATITSREYVTLSVFQTYYNSGSQGDALVKGYTRPETLEQKFGAYYQINDSYLKVGINIPSGILGPLAPYEANFTTEASRLWNVTVFKIPHIGGLFTTNGVYGGISHHISNYNGEDTTRKYVKLSKYNLDESVAADNSYTYDVLEEKWAGDKEVGFTGSFKYDLFGENFDCKVPMRAFAEAEYEVIPEFMGGITTVVKSTVAYKEHYVNHTYTGQPACDMDI